MRNSKQGITEMGGGKRRQKFIILIIIIYYYYNRKTSKSRSSSAKSKSFVNKAVRWDPGPKEKASAVDRGWIQSNYWAACYATRTIGGMEQREITHVRSCLWFSDQDHQLWFRNLE